MLSSQKNHPEYQNIQLNSGTFCQFSELPEQTIICFGKQMNSISDCWKDTIRPYVTKREYAASKRYLHAIDAVRHLTGRAIVRCALTAALDEPFCNDFSYTPYGKPFAPECDIHFSISHSGNMLWVALCRGAQVGIDVEQERPIPNLTELAEILHSGEYQELMFAQESSRLSTFYRCWTRKEAVLKAIGVGLSASLNSFQVYTDGRKKNWIANFGSLAHHIKENPDSTMNNTNWTSHDLSVGKDHQCNVVACKPNFDLQVFHT